MSAKFPPLSRPKTAFTALSLLLGAFGCTEPSEPGDSVAALINDGWTWCAVQGERCTFAGTRRVQFGAGPHYVTRSFTDGVDCDNAAFGVSFGSGNACYVLLDEAEQSAHVHADTSQSANAEPDDGAEHAAHDNAAENASEQPQAVPTSAATSAAAPTSEHDHSGATGSTTPTPSPTGSTAPMPTPTQDKAVMASAMPGPYVNKAAIPSGNPGSSVVEIRPTSEQPKPNNDVGAFRTSCAFSHMNNDDAIVFPGQPGKAHLHAYFGNTGANASSTAESLRNSGNSTCRGGIANRSSYWVPALVAKDGTPIKPQSAQIYYKTGYNGIAPRAVQVFPQGLRVIAGDAKASGPVQEHAFWACEVYNGHPKSIPDCPAGQALVMQVFFPQCWNGKDLDSADHKSHMAYPVNGACPATHPVAIPEVSFNVYYDVPAGMRASEWHLASDMYDQSLPGGYSAHGDWFEGWQRDIAEAFVKNCDNTSSDCHSHLLGDGREIYSAIDGI
jgi:hypothetical protein